MKKNYPRNTTYKSILNPKYISLHEFIISLPETFDALGNTTVLRDIRNVIKRVTVAGEDLVIKKFARPSILNRFIYGRLRKSKAMRAYEYSLRLQKMGLHTPEPIGAIDTYHHGTISQSFYVSRYSQYNSLECINHFMEHQEQIEPLLDALCELFITLHDAGVMYNDLNILNILYKELPDGKYDFELIDTNRISFHTKLSKKQRIQDLRRLSCAPIPYCYLLQQYAKRMNYDADDFQLMGLFGRLLLHKRHLYKQRLKHNR
ncbi:MAG: lipopolysaccharide kinase InaA family protein [Alistipes sp.]|nr:lipopolysaccharide kinase InaA family protein [Alistipes sp.]